MSDALVCPICDTANAASAVNCEVCGERLAPLADGEVMNPEENVAAMLATGGGGVDAHDDDDDAEQLLTGSFEIEEIDDEDDLYAAAPPPPAAGGSFDFGDDDDASFGDAGGEADVAAAPAVLYSPLDGTAYPQGSPEYEDGFGPMGEELVAERPEVAPADDAEEEAVAATEPEPEPEPAAPVITPLRKTVRIDNDITPLPVPSTFDTPATVTVYQNRQPAGTFEVDADELLIGRRDPVANAFPDIDLSGFDPDGHISRKHAYIYRQHKNYTLYVVSNTGTQLNNELLGLGERRTLSDGDVIILAGKLAMKFELPATTN